MPTSKPVGVLVSDATGLSGIILLSLMGSVVFSLITLWLLPVAILIAVLLVWLYVKSLRRVELYDDCFNVLSYNRKPISTHQAYGQLKDVVFIRGIRGAREYRLRFKDAGSKDIRITYQSFEPKKELEFIKSKGVNITEPWR